VGELRYYPYGETRYNSGSTPTSYHFTGQIEDATIRLYFYNARYCDDALGRVKLRTLGNNRHTKYVYYPWTTANGMGRLKYIKTGTAPSYTSLQKMYYAYDAVGNVLTIRDYKALDPYQTQTFTYDALDRLVTAEASGSASYGGYGQKTYAYDAIGNLMVKDVLLYDYGTGDKPHAVRELLFGGFFLRNTYDYDENGNMTSRNESGTSYSQAFDAENRLTTVSGAASATFVYDGDGNRIKATFSSGTTAYVGNHFEWTGSTSTMKKYYYANGQRIAMRVGNGSGTTGLNYLLSDHLGSTAITVNGEGTTEVGELRYYPYGETRYTSGSTPTSYRFTGQREDATIGLYFYNARYYDASLGRFVQADSIVPSPGNPQSLNRYSYVLNSPLRFVDPSGYFTKDAIIDYLQQTDEEWATTLSEWEANENWWTMLLEAQPGDILVMTNDQGEKDYGMIRGEVGGAGVEDDILLGIAPAQGIPRAFEEFEVGELQDVGAWLDGEVVGLARFESKRAFVNYWTPELDWYGTFFNVPTLYRPKVGETLHPGSWLMIAFLFEPTAAAFAVGIEIIEASPLAGIGAPLVVGVGLVPIGCGFWLTANAYNLGVTPKSGWNGH
jgi:RHS repeat-associated protein